MTDAKDALESIRGLGMYVHGEGTAEEAAEFDAAIAAWEKERAELTQWREGSDVLGRELRVLRAAVEKVRDELREYLPNSKFGTWSERDIWLANKADALNAALGGGA